MNVAIVLKNLREKKAKWPLEKKEALPKAEADYFVLPPFESRLAILSAQRAKWKGMALVAMAGMLLSLLGSVFWPRSSLRQAL
jgi:hypothetical protein